MFSLCGNKYLVTGASGGIGSKIVEAFSKYSAEVCLSGTKVETLKSVAQSYTGKAAHVIPCDLSNSEDISSLVKNAVNKMNGLDGVILNAGITKDKLALRMSDDEWQSVIDVNLTASFKIMRDACKVMMRNPSGGRIVCISSIVGVTGNVGQANYSASKAGLIGMSKTFALEFAKKGITVNCVVPGFIKTKMTDAIPEAYKKSILENIPMQRMGTPEEIASTVMFLVSKESSYITASTINVSGGLLRY